MKIRLLLDSRGLGGIETHVINLCAQLIANGHDCCLVFVRPYPDNILYSLCEHKSIPYLTPQTYKALFFLLTKQPADIIHAHGYKANLVARMLGLITKTAIVTTFHSGEKFTGRQRLYNFLDRWTSGLSNNIGVNSRITKSLPFNSKVIPNFVDIPEKTQSLNTKKPFKIYFIGRISPEKGPSRFCQLSEQSSTDFEWHMVGTGPLLDFCVKTYSKTVHFHGAILDMDTLWQKVDLLLITSSYEGLPFVLLEAMSRGIPVVSFDVGSVKEVISELHYVIEPFDLAKMKQVIDCHFLKSIEERVAMAQRARNKAIDHYSKTIVISQLEAFYQGCLK